MISRGGVVGDWEDFTVELVCELNLEVSRSLPVKKGEKVLWGDRRQVCKGIESLCIL